MIISTLYITSPGLIYFISGSVYLLTPWTHFTHSAPHPLWQPPICSKRDVFSTSREYVWHLTGTHQLEVTFTFVNAIIRTTTNFLINYQILCAGPCGSRGKLQAPQPTAFPGVRTEGREAHRVFLVPIQSAPIHCPTPSSHPGWSPSGGDGLVMREGRVSITPGSIMNGSYEQAEELHTHYLNRICIITLGSRYWFEPELWGEETEAWDLRVCPKSHS